MANPKPAADVYQLEGDVGRIFASAAKGFFDEFLEDSEIIIARFMYRTSEGRAHWPQPEDRQTGANFRSSRFGVQAIAPSSSDALVRQPRERQGPGKIVLRQSSGRWLDAPSFGACKQVGH